MLSKSSSPALGAWWLLLARLLPGAVRRRGTAARAAGAARHGRPRLDPRGASTCSAAERWTGSVTAAACGAAGDGGSSFGSSGPRAACGCRPLLTRTSQQRSKRIASPSLPSFQPSRRIPRQRCWRQTVRAQQAAGGSSLWQLPPPSRPGCHLSCRCRLGCRLSMPFKARHGIPRHCCRGVLASLHCLAAAALPLQRCPASSASCDTRRPQGIQGIGGA